MSNQQLPILPVDKTVIFYSPIEANHTLVRTGIIANDSNFLHALMRACSKEYSNRDETGREKYVSKIGKKLKRKNGMVSFQENVTQILTEIYSKILKNKDCKNILAQKVEKEIEPDRDTYEIIFEIVTLAHFEKEILQTDSDSKDLIEKTERFAEKTFSKLDIDEKRRKFCIDKLVSLVGKIAKQAGKSEVGKIEVNNEVINILSEKKLQNVTFSV